MKKAIVTCMCDKAGEACATCEQMNRINPDKIYYCGSWTWKGKEFKVIMREN